MIACSRTLFSAKAIFVIPMGAIFVDALAAARFVASMGA
jgi:hypothetical protein